MNSKFFMLAALTALGHSSWGQTTSSTTSTSPTSNTSVATTALPASTDDNVVKPTLKYLGYFHGTGVDFSGAHQAGINNEKQMNYEQRAKFLASLSKDLDVGVEARVNSNFGDGSQAGVSNGNWRLMANFKNVLKNEIFNLSLMPKIYLPTSSSARNQKVTPSPDMVVDMGISPKNTRFSFDLGMEYIRLFHSDGAVGSDYTNADTTIFAPWAEVDYQLTDKTTLMASYWPSFAAQGQRGAPLTSAFAQDGGNEIDMGGYYEFAKGWQVNPFVAAEMSDIGKNAPASRNLQLNFLIIGAIL